MEQPVQPATAQIADRRLKFSIAASVIVVFALLAAFRFVDLSSRHEQALSEAAGRAAIRARTLAESLHQVLAVADASLRQLAALSPRLGGPMGNRNEWQPVLNAAYAGLTGIGSLSVVDAEGVIRHSTIDRLIGQSRRNDYLFKQLLTEPASELVASTPFRTIFPGSSRLVIPIGRRLASADGNFNGIVVATFEPEQLRAFFRKMLAGKAEEVWVLHPGGEVLFREPSTTNPIGGSAAGNPIFEAARATSGGGTIRTALEPGGPELVSAFERTSEPVLIVAVSVRQAETLAAWRGDLYQSAVAFGVTALGLTAMLFILLRQIDARSAAENALRLETVQREREAANAREANNLAAARAAFAEELERKNNELEAFSYSVSHDLRSPLRSIDGFSVLLLQEHAGQLDAKAREYLEIVRAGAQRMGELIDDLLMLSRVSRTELHRRRVNLSQIAEDIADTLQTRDSRRAEFVIEPGVQAEADESLIRIVLENLLGNAWKFSSGVARPRIEFATLKSADGQTLFVRDNGAGFNMNYSAKLFRPFQRLHRQSEFPGTGIGLATVQRVIDRHGGRVWAESTVGQGAVFFFTIPDNQAE
jgi:signal transduction histidine kinase